MRPTVKFNSGNPAALCLKCSIISCYITFNKEKDEYVFKSSNQHTIDGVERGEKIPSYCKHCTAKELMIEKV